MHHHDNQIYNNITSILLTPITPNSNDLLGNNTDSLSGTTPSIYTNPATITLHNYNDRNDDDTILVSYKALPQDDDNQVIILSTLTQQPLPQLHPVEPR